MLPWSLPVTVLVVIAGIVLSAFFAGSEVAMFGLRRAAREQMAKSERSDDRRVMTLLRAPRQLLVAVLICNELVNAGVVILALALVRYIWPAAAWWQAILCVVAAVVPLMVLLTEITPKALALRNPQAWVWATVTPLSLFVNVVAPLRYLISGTADRICAWLGAPRRGQPQDLSAAEFRSLVDAGSAQGQVDASERRIIHRMFEFADKNVGQIMTPRERIFALSYDLPKPRLVAELTARGFSRVPIYVRSLDNLRGVLNAKDLLDADGRVTRSLNDVLHEPLFVPRTTPVKRLFVTFKQKKVHMALVVNEYGKLLGLVTMDDVLAQIFGVLRDERERNQQAKRTRTPPQGVETRSAGVLLETKPEVAADSAEALPPATTPVDAQVGHATAAHAPNEAVLRSFANTGTADVRRQATLPPLPMAASELVDDGKGEPE